MPWKPNTKVRARALALSRGQTHFILSQTREGRLNLETVPSGVKGNLNLREKKKTTQLAEVKATSALMVMT